MTKRRWPLLTGLGGAALAVAAITVASRAAGFGRVIVFARTVGTTCLGSTYYTANTVPNIVFEVVAGGALAAIVVPLLAAPLTRGDRAEVSRTTSALLTWSLLALVPLAVLGLALRGPVIEALVGTPPAECPRDDVVTVGARMLAVFLPQIPLYAIGIVLTGLLQAHRRFLGPALAPLLSTLVVAGAYLTYEAVDEGRDELASLSRGEELLLSLGTTAGVAVLSLSLLVPLARTGVRIRPALRFPPGVARQARLLALAGAATLLAQQLAVAVSLRLANDAGPEGAAVSYNLAWAVFLLPWAVLAVPLATSAFPRLAEAAASGDEEGYAETAATTTRAVVLATVAAVAVLVAAALPLARILVLGASGRAEPAELARAIALFAPGLLGYALVAHLGRALFARGDGRAAARAIVAGWVAVAGAAVALVPLVPDDWVVATLGGANSIGMTLAGVLLLWATRRQAPRATADLRRTALVAGVAGGAAVLAGLALASGIGPVGVGASVAVSVAVALLCVAVFVLVALVVDRRGLRQLAGALRA